MRSRFIFASFTLLMSLIACSSSGSHVNEVHPRKFVIWVVGRGDPVDPLLRPNSEGGDFLYNALWAGAAIGWKEAKRESSGLDDAVELKPADDHHSPEEAAALAQSIRRNPYTLAVIGHDQSNTTNAAEPIYADAGIPVIFPAATSSLVGDQPAYRAIFFRSSDHFSRATNFVRLPPPDVPYQSHALRVAAFAIAEKKGLDSGGQEETSPEPKAAKRRIRIYVIRETSHNADVYSEPIGNALQNDDRFAKLVVGERRFDREQLDVYTLVTSIRGARADLVLFIGYPESAMDLLEEMKERMQQQDKNTDNGPVFLFADACLSRDLAEARFPFDIYVTSSTLTLDQCAASKEYGTVLEDLRTLNSQRPITAEVYSADAILLLSRAIEHCRGTQDLGRRCVLDYVRGQREVQSVCRNYHLDDGESGNAVYLLYEHAPGSGNAGLVPTGFIRSDHEKLLSDWSLR